MRGWCIAWALLVATMGTPARAGEDSKETARQAYREASKYYNLNRFAEALAAFERAYFAYEDPAILFNIAQCHRQLGHKDDAVKFYKSYLRTSRQAPNRVEVEKMVAELNVAIEKERALQTAHPEGTQPVSPPLDKHPEPAPQTARVEPQPVPAASLTVAPVKKSSKKGAIIGGVVGGVLAVGLAVGLGVGLGTQSHAPTAGNQVQF